MEAVFHRAVDTTRSLNDHVAFQIGRTSVTNDLGLLLFAAAQGRPVRWYTRAQMAFMAAAAGPQWKRFSEGPALRLLGTQES